MVAYLALAAAFVPGPWILWLVVTAGLLGGCAAHNHSRGERGAWPFAAMSMAVWIMLRVLIGLLRWAIAAVCG